MDPDSLGLNRTTVLEIIRDVSFKIRKANNDVFKPYDIHLSHKNLSEIIGKIMEKTASDILTRKLGYPVKNAENDSEPDLFFSRVAEAVEIKITSTANAWTGGEFSQRPFDYLLVSWGEDFDEYFVAYVHLEKSDWHSNISRGFYGPSYKASDLFKNKEKTVFLGRFDVSRQGNARLRREKVIFQDTLS